MEGLCIRLGKWSGMCSYRKKVLCRRIPQDIRLTLLEQLQFVQITKHCVVPLQLACQLYTGLLAAGVSAPLLWQSVYQTAQYLVCLMFFAGSLWPLNSLLGCRVHTVRPCLALRRNDDQTMLNLQLDNVQGCCARKSTSCRGSAGHGMKLRFMTFTYC